MRVWNKLEPSCRTISLVKLIENKSIMLVNFHDMENMQALMTKPEMQEWNKANGCVDEVNAIQRVYKRYQQIIYFCTPEYISHRRKSLSPDYA